MKTNENIANDCTGAYILFPKRLNEKSYLGIRKIFIHANKII